MHLTIRILNYILIQPRCHHMKITPTNGLVDSMLFRLYMSIYFTVKHSSTKHHVDEFNMYMAE